VEYVNVVDRLAARQMPSLGRTGLLGRAERDTSSWMKGNPEVIPGQKSPSRKSHERIARLDWKNRHPGRNGLTGAMAVERPRQSPSCDFLRLCQGTVTCTVPTLFRHIVRASLNCHREANTAAAGPSPPLPREKGSTVRLSNPATETLMFPMLDPTDLPIAFGSEYRAALG